MLLRIGAGRQARISVPGAAVKAASRRAPEEGAYWNTLAAALYRAGEWGDAKSALDRSLALRDGGDACDWLLLAMVEWRLGNSEASVAWYRRAVAALPPDSEEVTRLRDEAASVLGLEGAAGSASAPPAER